MTGWRLDARAYVDWALKYARLAWAVTALVLVLAGWRSVQLFSALRSDLESLLPQSAPSVLALQEMRSRMAGIRVLGVVVDAGDGAHLRSAERFLDDLALRVRKLPPDMVASVRTDVAEDRAFITAHAALYAKLEDLQEIRRRIEARKQWEAAEAAGANLDDEPAPSVDVSDIEARYRKQDPSARLPDNGRLTNVSEHVTVMLVDVPGYSTGADRYRALMDRVRAEAEALGGTGAYAPGMRIGFAGAPALAVEELESLQGDLTISSLIVGSAVLLSLLAFFRWWPSVPVLSLPLVVGVCTAFAVASLPPFGVTQLNANTAFLGSIIVGNGVNFGIILLARYLEERRAGAELRDALATAISSTRTATVTAASAAAVAYGSLATTQFRGFWQFGVIGGIGMLVCWASAFLLMPSLIAAFDRGRLPPSGKSWFAPAALAARLVMRAPRLVVIGGAALVAMALVGSRTFGPERFDTDFSKLRRQGPADSGARYWGARMETVLGQNISPIVMLTDSREETLRLAELVRTTVANDPELGRAIDRVTTFADRIPLDQEAKLQEVGRIKASITPWIRSQIPADRMAQVDRILGDAEMRAVEEKDVPASLLTGFLERDGSVDKVVHVRPSPGKDRWRGTSLMAVARRLRSLAADAPGPDGRPARIAGQMPLSADITASVFADAPRAIAVALAGVLLLVLATFRLSRETALVLGSLFVGVLWLVWATMLFDLEINFINFVAFPIAFGIGIDYSVNVASRYRLDDGDVGAAIRSTGGAVGLCSLTTIIGYSSLLIADNRGLFSFGVVSVIGEVTCLASAVLLMPALVVILQRRKQRRVASQVASEGL